MTCSDSQQYQVVAVDDFKTFAGRVEGGEGIAFFFGDGGDFFAGESSFSTGEWGAIRAGDVDDVADGELAGRMCHSDGEQAAALFAKHGNGAGVDGNGACRALKIGEP